MDAPHSHQPPAPLDGDARSQVTIALQQVSQGDSQAAAALLPLVYAELRSLAASRLRHEQAGQTLQPTALVHEAYMRLVGEADPGWKSRGHFFAAAAQAMRNILVDQHRRKSAAKRGGNIERVDFDAIEPPAQAPAADLVALDDAVRRLEASDPRKGQIVNLRFFAGLTAEETALALDVSVGTIEREWRYIRAWLKSELEQHEQ